MLLRSIWQANNNNSMCGSRWFFIRLFKNLNANCVYFNAYTSSITFTYCKQFSLHFACQIIFLRNNHETSLNFNFWIFRWGYFRFTSSRIILSSTQCWWKAATFVKHISWFSIRLGTIRIKNLVTDVLLLMFTIKKNRMTRSQ